MNVAIPSGIYDEDSVWWQHELLHREVLKDFYKRAGLFLEDRDEIEKGWIEQALAAGKDLGARKSISETAFKQAGEMTIKWLNQVKNERISRKNIFYYDCEWRKNNRKAKIPV